MRFSCMTSKSVDRCTSYVIFPMQFAHWITCISRYMAQDEPPNVSVCALHSIFMSSMMCAWAFVVCLFVFVLLLFLSVVYLFSSSLYLYSAQYFISNVNSAEGNSHCAFAQWGVLHHWRYTILQQVMSPTSLTTSTTQRLRRWSSRTNPAT